MRILILNPNTTASLTARLVAVARTVAGPDTEVLGTQPSWGVPAVQGYQDGFVSAAASLDCVRGRLDRGEDRSVRPISRHQFGQPIEDARHGRHLQPGHRLGKGGIELSVFITDKEHAL